MIEDGLDFVFLFSINQFRWWLDEVWTVGLGFVITCEERGVKDVMDLPRMGQLESICDQ